MEPIFLSPVFKDYIWGGKKLKEIFKKQTPYEITAESWEISTNKNGKSNITKGKYEGINLGELYEKEDLREEIFGSKTIGMNKFPLLVKFIDANSNLSVQVHPDNKYAYEKENGEDGKTEMWYIMECKPGAQIICGMKKEVRQKDLKDILTKDNVSDYLEFLDVQEGDVIYIPSGTIHAILGDTVICEVQQNSDLTYRVYDWGRMGNDGKPRELHVEKAIDVVAVENHPELKQTSTQEKQEETIIASEYFKTNKIKINGTYEDTSNQQTFYAMNVVKGSGIIEAQGKEHELNLGDSFIIPATLGQYQLKGNLELLKSYI